MCPPPFRLGEPMCVGGMHPFISPWIHHWSVGCVQYQREWSRCRCVVGAAAAAAAAADVLAGLRLHQIISSTCP